MAESRYDVGRIAQFCNLILSAESDAVRDSLAHDSVAAYRSLNADSRDAFVTFLANLQNPSIDTLLAPARAVEPRKELFGRLGVATEGVGMLIDMRSHMLNGLHNHPSWIPVEDDLAGALRTRFAPHHLEFRRVESDAEPDLLASLVRFEAVHRIRDTPELRRRLQSDRRCFGLFHSALPHEPVVFTELALTAVVSEAVQPLLNPESPIVDARACRCAVFYSISNCRDGLRGMGFGGSLIRRSVDSLRAEFPGLKTFATLSPIPGFREWLADVAQTGDRMAGDLVAQLDDASWVNRPAVSTSLKRRLIPLCAYYLVRARRGSQPADAVARFHLGNGARLERVNWLGDISDTGIRRSAGLAVNYRYSLEDLDRNQEAYVTRGTVVASRQVERSARLAVNYSMTRALNQPRL
jgi:malonyl-CoA decarboxylase